MSSIATPKRASVRAASWAGRAPDRAQQHAMKKQAILRTAALAFREAGYHDTSLDDIARRLNVTKPTLYYYVRSKEDILLGCQQQGFDQIGGYLEEVEASGLPGREMLRLVMVRYGEWVTGEFGTCVAQMWNVRVSPATRAQLDEARHALQAGIRRILERGRRDGSLAGVDVGASASAMCGAFHEAVPPSAQRHHQLLKCRVARTRSETIDGTLNLSSTMGDCCDRVGNGHSEIVMAMSADHILTSDPSPNCGQSFAIFLGDTEPNGVGNIECGRAGIHSNLKYLAHEIEITPRSVLG